MGKPENVLEHVWRVFLQLGEKKKTGRARTTSPIVRPIASLLSSVHLSVSATLQFPRQDN